jgi:glycolate oxidase
MLAEALAGAGEVIFDPDVLASYSRDQAAPGLLEPGEPAALVRPASTAEVAAAVRAAVATGTPIVPRGAGSGLSGGANAIDGCIVLSLERMDGLVALDAPSLRARVQPGLINAELSRAAAPEGLRYAPDPASHEFSTLGGNIATNAGGLCCVKYGVTREAVLALEVVLGDGRVVELGGGTRKGVVGYDLVSLFCGSEGTLGIVTEATLRLEPTPPVAATLAAGFPTLEGAARAVAEIVRHDRPSVLELIDRTTIAAVEAFAPQGLDPETEALLFAQSDAGPGAALREVEVMAERCERHGAALAAVTDEAAEGRLLMNARRLAYTALEASGATLLDDVCVPVGRIPELIEGVAEIAAAAELTIGTFGHAGDGNMHPTVVYDRADPDQVAAARGGFDRILELALSLGGTVTGEHGVGALKLAAAAGELGKARDLHLAVKRALDPDGLLNPGKAI